MIRLLTPSRSLALSLVGALATGVSLGFAIAGDDPWWTAWTLAVYTGNVAFVGYWLGLRVGKGE